MPITDPPADFFTWVKSLCCMLVAFSFQQNLFPVYSSLALKTNQNCQKISTISISTVFLIYVFLSVVCVFLFGNQITAEGSNVIQNVNLEYQYDPSHWEAFLLRILFGIVLACHIPFIFFSGKEAILIILSEISSRALSEALDIRVREL